MNTDAEVKKIKGRPCVISHKDENSFKEVPAQFHCWGSRPPKDPIKDIKHFAVTETVGICELPNGAIRLIKPERIRFTDRGTP